MSKRMLVFLVIWPVFLLLISWGGVAVHERGDPATPRRDTAAVKSSPNDPSSVVRALWAEQDRAWDACAADVGERETSSLLSKAVRGRWVQNQRLYTARSIDKVEKLGPERWKITTTLVRPRARGSDDGMPRYYYIVVKESGDWKIAEIHRQCHSCYGERTRQCHFCDGEGRRIFGDWTEKCEECKGTGRSPCDYCNGTGWRDVLEYAPGVFDL